MKLLSLSMTAFGPFAGTELIDFTLLGDNPLFLIDGPTGAGKSSILHGICYALYGETTDTERKDMGLRCDFAPLDRLTTLELRFQVGGSTYVISRTPTQLRPSHRGEGFTEEKATAHLRRIKADGSEETLVAKKKKDADDYITQIIGLTADQFRQVMVLPQGKFRELLLADSKERQAILSTLFQTQVYQQIEELLKQKARHIEQQEKDLTRRESEALSELGLPARDAITSAQQDAEAQKATIDQKKQVADQARQEARAALDAAHQLLQDFQERTKLEAAIEALKLQAPEVNTKRSSIVQAKAAQKITPDHERLQQSQQEVLNSSAAIKQVEQDLERHTAALAEATVAFDKATEAYQQRDGLKAKLTNLESIKSKVDDFVAAKLKAAHQQRALAQGAAVLEGLIASITQQEQLLKENKQTIKAAKETVATKSGIEKIAHQLTTAIQAAKARDKAMASRESAAQHVKNLLNNQAEVRVKFNAADTQLKRLKVAWFTSQAAILASELNEGEPCAVCGSKEHPHLAQYEGEPVSQEQLDAAEQQCAGLKDELAEIHVQISKFEEVVKQAEEIITEQRMLLADDKDSLVTELDKRLTQHQLALQKVIEQEQLLVSLEADLENNEQQLDTLRKQWNDQNEAITTLQNEAVRAEEKLAALADAVPEQYRDAEKINREIKSISLNINNLEETLNSTSSIKSNAESLKNDIAGRLVSLKSTHEGFTAKQELAAEHWQQVLVASQFEDEAAFKLAAREESFIAQLESEVAQHDEALRHNHSQLDVYAGKLAGKASPNLEALNAELQAKNTAFESIDEEATAINIRLNDLLTCNNKLAEIDKERARIENEINVVGKLSAAASGNAGVKVSLERFVLGNILDSVLTIASQRLHQMSKGQYTLIRQNEQQQKKNQTAGLNLAIDDAHTGKTRPVQTLSGGESFMASLALALGLSEVAQQRSGGIQLDTLFIDEGFGSLDSDTLQLAINMLTDLRDAGRTIGIISHVGEFREQMALRIDVKPSAIGSTTSMKCA